MTSLDTLKQAAQALRNTRNPHVLDLVAALEAMAEQKPIGYVLKGREWPNQCYYPESHKPTDIDNWKAVYSAPIATPEHDAQMRNEPHMVLTAADLEVLTAEIRNAALEEAAQQCKDIYSWKGAFTAGLLSTPTLAACASAIRALKATGGAA